MNALPESTQTAGTFPNNREPQQMESSTLRATEPAPALLAHSSLSSTRLQSSVRSTILSLLAPLRTQRRRPWASQSCLVEAARMFFTLSSPGLLGDPGLLLSCVGYRMAPIHLSAQMGDSPKFAQLHSNTHALLG